MGRLEVDLERSHLPEGAQLSVLGLQLACSLFMTGLIWFVQVVHYPLFATVDQEAFRAYEEEHCRRTGWVVGPVMLLELGTALVCYLQGLPGLKAANILLFVIWCSTALVQMPCHARLGRGFCASVHRLLVRSNWLRTAAWTARSGLLIVALQS